MRHASLILLSLFLALHAPGQTLAVSGTPTPGSVVTLTVAGPPGAPYYLVGSFEPGPTLYPPFGSFGIGIPFFFLVSVSPSPPTIGASGVSSTNIFIPNVSWFIGEDFYAQALVADPMSTTGFTMTNAVSFVVQTSGSPSGQPNITSITPDHAQVGGGSLVTVTGTGLGPGTTVSFGGQNLIPLSQTATEIIGLAPNYGQIGFVDVAASSTVGYQVLTSAFRYTIPLDVGNGSDGPFMPTQNTTLDTSTNQGVFNFTTIVIPAGVEVSATGPFPLHLKCTGSVAIDGVLDVSGQDGGAPSGTAPPPGGAGGPAGFAGGDGGWPLASSQSGHGPGGGARASTSNNGAQDDGAGGSYGTQGVVNSYQGPAPTYGDPELVSLVGGSGGGGSYMGSGGGGGGGAIGITASGTIQLSGSIVAEGGSADHLQERGGGGSGGAIRLRSQGNVVVTGVASVAGGVSNLSGGNGRWFIESWAGQSVGDVVATVPLGVY